MDIASDADRVRAYEPVPGMPSGADPLFGEFVRRLSRTTYLRLGLSTLLVGFGLLLTLEGRQGTWLPYFYFVVFGTSLAFWGYVLSVYLRVQSHNGQPYHRLDVALDGLLRKGTRLSVRLPDGRWLRTRFPDGARVQLAGERRLWVLGTGRRVFVRPPGAMWVRGGKIVDEPVPGSAPAEAVSRRPTPPRADPVLAAHRAFQLRRLRNSAVTFLLVGAIGFAVVFTVGSGADGTTGADGITGPAAMGGIAGGSGVFVVLGLLFLVALARFRPQLTEDVWVELRIALDAPFRPGNRGLVRLNGWAMHPDGRQTRFRLTADVSLAANAATTGQLWLLGYPQPGKPAKAGLPGYPCAGTFRMA